MSTRTPHTIVSRPPERTRRAFTLIEILVVVVILGILSAIVFTTFGDAAGDARTSAAATDLRHLQTQVDVFAQDNGGNPPGELNDTLLRQWFGTVRKHPFALTTTPLGVENASGAGPAVRHPADKIIAGAAHGWWYNPDNGAVRSRVRDLGDAAANIALYNLINNANITAMAQTD